MIMHGRFIFIFLLLGLQCYMEDATSTESFENMAATKRLVSVEFEVYGKVQGVFFRKNTVIEGKKLGLKGWCKNTSQGTVKGIMEGETDKIKEMKHWLSKVGSKASRIEKADFSNEKLIDKYNFKEFSVYYE